MNVNEKILDRLEEMISICEEILRESQPTISYIGRSPVPSHTIESAKTTQWRMNCLQIISNSFGRESSYYKEFDEHSKYHQSLAGYDGVTKCLGILRAAKSDYENSYLIEHVINNCPVITDDIADARSENLINNYDEEAKRNARIYLTNVFVVLLFVLLAFLYFFSVKYSFFFTIGILIVSYVLSGLTLKEWTPTKLPERIFEYEKHRIYKKFGIDEKTSK